MKKKDLQASVADIDRFLTLDEVCYVTGLSRTEIMERRVPQGRFPTPHRLGKHPNSKLAWRKSAIEKWLADQDENGYDFERKPANDNTPPAANDNEALYLSLEEVSKVTRMARTD